MIPRSDSRYLSKWRAATNVLDNSPCVGRLGVLDLPGQCIIGGWAERAWVQSTTSTNRFIWPFRCMRLGTWEEGAYARKWENDQTKRDRATCGKFKLDPTGSRAKNNGAPGLCAVAKRVISRKTRFWGLFFSFLFLFFFGFAWLSSLEPTIRAHSSATTRQLAASNR